MFFNQPQPLALLLPLPCFPPLTCLQALSEYAAAHAVEASPTPLEYLSFVFGLGNLLAGPYIEYVDYRDFIELKGVGLGKREGLRGGVGGGWTRG